MKEPDYRADAEIIQEHLYFLGSDGQGNNKIFDWLSYMTVIPRSEYLTYEPRHEKTCLRGLRPV